LEWLQKSITSGYTDVNHIENDNDLKSLRNLDEYKAIIASLKSSTARPVPAEPAKPTEVKTAIPVQFSHVVPVAKPIEVKPVAPVETKTVVPVTFVVPTAPPEEEPKPVKDDNAPLAVLLGMGLSDVESNITALSQAKGDIAAAVQILLTAYASYYVVPGHW